MADNQTASTDFRVKALEIAELLTRGNSYPGSQGQTYAEARATDMRRVLNILEGRAADQNTFARAPGTMTVPGRPQP